MFERLGRDTIERLVRAFYARVDRDPEIRPLYPKGLGCPIENLTKFLSFWCGGPSPWDADGGRLRRRHHPFSIDARAAEAWIVDMRGAIADVGIAEPEASMLAEHFTFGARALINSGGASTSFECKADDQRFDAPMAELWNRMARAEDVFEAVSSADFDLLEVLLGQRLVPHAKLIKQALAESLDPDGRVDRRYGRRPKHADPRRTIEFLLAHPELDVAADVAGDNERFTWLEATLAAYSGAKPLFEPDSAHERALRRATHDRFLAEVARDARVLELRGARGQSLLHDAALYGLPEAVRALLQRGADPNAAELGGHAPLYRAKSGEVARELIAAGAALEAKSGPTQGTALHQAARHGHVSVVLALLEAGADVGARDRKGETPLRRAKNCKKPEVVELLLRFGAS